MTQWLQMTKNQISEECQDGLKPLLARYSNEFNHCTVGKIRKK